MKVCGIIVEYNPFHNGHIYHIQKAREITGCDLLVAVTSGNFTQRGEPSIINKWKKTKYALDNGIDLVVELPFIYSNQSASQFAKGAISILKLLNCDSIVFGSESNNLDELKEIANMPINTDNLKENLKTGMGFPKAYGLMAKEYMPNDILAVAYLKELNDSSITPYSIQRTSEYNSTELNGDIASAKAIREAFINNQDYSAYTPVSIDKEHFVSLEMYYPMLRTILLTQSSKHLASLFLVDEGIENHLIDCANKYDNFNDFIKNATTRRYTRSRIQRTLVSILCQNDREYIRKMPKIDTIQVLGFNSKGQKYLKQLQKQEIKVASRYNQIPKPYRMIQYKAAVIYSMFFKDQREFLKREISGPIRKIDD